MAEALSKASCLIVAAEDPNISWYVGDSAPPKAMLAERLLGIGDGPFEWATHTLAADSSWRDLLMTLQAPAVRESRATYDAEPNYSPRELEVLAQVAMGLTNDQIAAVTGLRVQSVKNLVRSLLSKSGCASRVRLALKYQDLAA